MAKQNRTRPVQKEGDSQARGTQPITVRDIMTADVVFCTPETTVREIAQLMLENDCGEVPVVENREALTPLGVVTDRDIVCRVIARGINPLQTKARECMSAPAVTVRQDTDVDACSEVMSAHRIRRVPVVDGDGACRGIVSQADLATKVPGPVVTKLIREVSRPA